MLHWSPVEKHPKKGKRTAEIVGAAWYFLDNYPDGFTVEDVAGFVDRLKDHRKSGVPHKKLINIATFILSDFIRAGYADINNNKEIHRVEIKPAAYTIQKAARNRLKAYGGFYSIYEKLSTHRYIAAVIDKEFKYDRTDNLQIRCSQQVAANTRNILGKGVHTEPSNTGTRCSFARVLCSDTD